MEMILTHRTAEIVLLSADDIIEEMKTAVTRTPRLKAVYDRVIVTKRPARAEDLELSGFTGACVVCGDFKLNRYIADTTHQRLGCLGTAYEPKFLEFRRTEKRNKIHFAIQGEATKMKECISGIPDYNLFAMMAYDLEWADGMVLNHMHGDQCKFDGVELVTQSENARQLHHIKYAISTYNGEGYYPNCTYTTDYGKIALRCNIPAKGNLAKINFLGSIPNLTEKRYPECFPRPRTAKIKEKLIQHLGATRLVDAYAEGYIEQVYGVTVAERALFYAE